MKNKIFVLLIILSLSVTLMACGEKPEAANQTDIEAEEPKDETEPVEKPQAEESTDMEEANTDDENIVEEDSDDKNGMDLLESMKVERPQTLRIVSEMIASNMTTTITSYYDGDKSKTEIDIPNMPKSISIYIPDEEVMYQYVYGESIGMKITGIDNDGAGEMGLMMDTSLLTALKESDSDDLIARSEKLDGEEVIYIESTQADEDMGEMLVKMWYSEKYATPLKYEVYVGQTLMTELNVTKINDNVNFNEDTFMPPEDIDFQEVNIETMMNFE